MDAMFLVVKKVLKKVSKRVSVEFQCPRRFSDHIFRYVLRYSTPMSYLSTRCRGTFSKTMKLEFEYHKRFILTLYLPYIGHYFMNFQNAQKLLEKGAETGCGGLPKGHVGEQCWSVCFDNDCNNVRLLSFNIIFFFYLLLA